MNYATVHTGEFLTSVDASECLQLIGLLLLVVCSQGREAEEEGGMKVEEAGLKEGGGGWKEGGEGWKEGGGGG